MSRRFLYDELTPLDRLKAISEDCHRCGAHNHSMELLDIDLAIQAMHPAPETPALASREPGTLADVLSDDRLRLMLQGQRTLPVERYIPHLRAQLVHVVQPLVDGLTQRTAPIAPLIADLQRVCAEKRARYGRSRDDWAMGVKQTVEAVEKILQPYLPKEAGDVPPR